MDYPIFDDEYCFSNAFDEFFKYLYPYYCSNTITPSNEEFKKNCDHLKAEIFPSDNQIELNQTCLLYRARMLLVSELVNNQKDEKELNFWSNYVGNYFNCSTITELHKRNIQNQIKVGANINKKIVMDLSNGYLGYNKEKSNAPPIDKCKEERCNKKHERILYLADNIETCLLECIATRNTVFSIGEFIPNIPLKIYDFSTPSPSIIKMAISQIFSNITQDNNYHRSQILAKIIKSLGYDGIKYISTKNSNGCCYAIFNPDNFNCVRSYLVKPLTLSITYLK